MSGRTTARMKVKRWLYKYGFLTVQTSKPTLDSMLDQAHHVCCCWGCESRFGWYIPWWTVIWECQENFPFKLTTQSRANAYMEAYFDGRSPRP